MIAKRDGMTPEDFRGSPSSSLRSGRAVGRAARDAPRGGLAELPDAFALRCDKDATIKVMVAP
jgi:hypothetical protein